MTQEWGSLPLLPLRCVMEHLSTEDALAAMSTCRHWRSTILLYEGHKDTLKIRAKQLKKALFLSRIFRRYTRKLHVYLDGTDSEIEKFMTLVLPQFFETVKLQELLFIGPSYIQQNHYVPFIKLKRILTESLVFKNIHCIETFALLGCELDVADDDEKDIHRHIEYYSRGLLFSRNTILSAVNLDIPNFSSTLRHIIIDYSQLSTACLLAVAPLRNLQYLTLNINNKRCAWPQIDWIGVNRVCDSPLQVILNIIAVPYRRFNDIMNHVLVEGLHLISLKVLFCRSIYTPLLSHVSRLYPRSLQEVVWTDSACDSFDPYHRIVRPITMRQVQTDDPFAHVNPFLLLCWQCIHLRRLVIHGYWLWHYDLLGFVRLRKTLTELDVSSIYMKSDLFDDEMQMSEEGAVRVMAADPHRPLDTDVIDEINEFTEFNWQPTPWSSLHPALRARSTTAARNDYILNETMRPLGVTLY